MQPYQRDYHIRVRSKNWEAVFRKAKKEEIEGKHDRE